MFMSSDAKPQTTILPRQLGSVVCFGVVALILMSIVLLRRDVATDFGPTVWWASAIILATIAAVLLHRVFSARPLMTVTPTHLDFPHILSKPIKWSRIQRIEVATKRTGLRDAKDRVIIHFKRPVQVAWRTKRMRDRIGDLSQLSLSISIDHAWPCRAADVRKTIRDAALNFANAPKSSTMSTRKPSLGRHFVLGGFLTAFILVPVISHATGFGFPRIFSKGLGYYQAGEIATALPYLRTDARAGDPEAAYVLGLLYANGDGVERNLSMALGWFQRATTNGSAKAAFQIGDAYRLGLGTPKNIDQAVAWYSRAANDGVPKAAHALSNIYRLGDGVRRDYAHAIRWLQVAASHDYVPAHHELGRLHLDGIGVPQDAAMARNYFERASNAGHLPARFDLAELLLAGAPRDKAKGADMLRSVAAAGFAPAQRSLAKRLYSGSDFSRNLVAAYKWMSLAERSWRTSGQRDLTRERLGIQRLLTPDQLAVAKSQVRDWKPALL